MKKTIPHPASCIGAKRHHPASRIRAKHAILPLMLLFIVFVAGCKKSSSDDTNTFTGYTETLYTNPADNQIYAVDSAGFKAVFMGPKDANGLPTAITQALVDAPDKDPQHKLLLNFNGDGTVSQISNPTMGYMNFTYVNDTTIVIKLTLADTLGSFQITFNPQKHRKSLGDCGCGKKKPAVTGPKRSDIFTAHKSLETTTRSKRALSSNIQHPTSNILHLTSVQGTITATYNPGGEYVAGLTMSAQYVTDNGKTGVVQVVPWSQDGVFTYSLPDNPAPPPPSGFSAKIKFLLNAMCWGQTPKGLTREGICGEFAQGGPNPGTLVCDAMLGAYLFLCRASTATKVSQEVFDLYTSSKVTITITAQSPVFASQSKTVDFIPSGGTLSDVAFMYNGAASFSSVNTDPESPVAKEGYTITAVLTQTGAGGTVTVRLSMIGSDNYTKSQDFQVEPGGSCQLSIPGGAQGVRDDITAQIITGFPPLPGQLIRLHLIFQ